MCINVFYLQYIERKYSQSEIDQPISFKFVQRDDCIQFNFKAPQDESIIGWNIQPHMEPSRVSICIMYELMCVYQ